MNKWLGLVFALVILSVFSYGCARMAQETKVKCPKCGTIFTITEKPPYSY